MTWEVFAAALGAVFFVGAFGGTVIFGIVWVADQIKRELAE